MKKIDISTKQKPNMFTLVDDEDYEELSKYKWHTMKTHNNFYAARSERIGKTKTRAISMHRQILGLKYKDGNYADHINHNGLDNRRQNLRKCSMRQNRFNQRPQKNRTSKYKGVFWHKRRKKWLVAIKKNGKQRHIGYFDNEIKAAKAYNETAKEIFGEFAYLNNL